MYTEVIKKLRIDHEKTQKEIASYLKITQQHYSTYENGIHEMPIHHLIELALYYNVTTDYILEMDKIKEYKNKK